MESIITNSLIVISIITFAYFSYYEVRKHKNLWYATVTPLASIIGSGFLVSVPLMVMISGKYAPIAMLGVVSVAYLLGSVIRFNIKHLEPIIEKEKNAKDGEKFYHSKIAVPLEQFSHPVLGIAYMISVAFYLKLFSAFALQYFMEKNEFLENILTTTILLSIGIVGWIRGLKSLENIEEHAVNLKLILIGSMVVGFAAFNIEESINGYWAFPKHDPLTDTQTFEYLLGVLIIVQGFETSRYMGELYSKTTRIKTMKYAQIIASIIYVVFIAAAMVVFADLHIEHPSETIIIPLSKAVSPILPPILMIAALMSQLSAAIADTIGSSGLMVEASKKVINTKLGTLLTVIVAITLVWLTNVFEIIVIASKAFAFYYGIQCLIAARLSYDFDRKKHMVLYIALFILMGFVVILGRAVG